MESEPCASCETGTAHRSLITHTIPYGDDGAAIVIENCPAWVCDTCDEGYLKGHEYEPLETAAIAEFRQKAGI